MLTSGWDRNNFSLFPKKHLLCINRIIISRSFHKLIFLILFQRWNQLLEQISEQLRSSKTLLGLWQRYKLLHSQCVTAVQKQEERTDQLLRSATDRDITEEESLAWIKDCCVSRDATQFRILQP